MGVQVPALDSLSAGCLLFLIGSNQLDQIVDAVFRITIFLSSKCLTSYIWVSLPLLILTVNGPVSLYLTLLFMIMIWLCSSSILAVISLLMLA
jgi:hypothetical protein